MSYRMAHNFIPYFSIYGAKPRPVPKVAFAFTAAGHLDIERKRGSILLARRNDDSTTEVP